jgi:hypothetical protein
MTGTRPSLNTNSSPIKIELGTDIPKIRPLRPARQALKNAGFEIELEEDLADRPDPIPWYYLLEGDISEAETFWDYITVWRISSWSGKLHGCYAARLAECAYVPQVVMRRACVALSWCRGTCEMWVCVGI